VIVVTLVRRVRNVSAAFLGIFGALAGLAQALLWPLPVRLVLASVAVVGAVLAIVLLLIEQGAERGEEVAGRFKSALELLGEANARVGAIHLLERVVQDAPGTYHQPMVETLTAFIRTAAPWPPADVSDDAAGRVAKRRPSPDVQAAVMVLGRSNRGLDGKQSLLRFSDVDLRGVSMRGGHFKGVRLRRAHLEGASLEGVDFQGARLRDAHFEGADFSEDVEEGLKAANLKDANIEGTNFEGANLTGVQLTGAVYDGRTRWPRGFDPNKTGARQRP
jgi:pentapeptide repeat protein